jgi:DNA-binding GntR family transcriptional regulator
LEAVEQRDADKARAAMRDHLKQIREDSQKTAELTTAS